ncbi:MAG: peptidoglycan DD-metalloendopeptidase family protein [Bacteroidetes bacterium]|nr:peptidoglycan DD-metalloendopeptidase family protein [Bacteroidota bacterium]
MIHKERKFFYILLAVIAALLFILTLRVRHISYLHRETGKTGIDTLFEVKMISPNYYIKSGLVGGDLKMEKGVVNPGDHLTSLLPDFVSPAIIDEIFRSSVGIFNFNRLISGKTYYLFYSDSGILRNFIYEPGKLDFIMVSMGDTIIAFRGRKEVETRTTICSGTIKTSLWDVIAQKNISPEVITGLSEIYAWAIDFYRLQKGDSFTVVYEHYLIHEESAGMGKILAASFTHRGKDYFSFRFEQDGEEGYYDLDAKSLKMPFLKAPLKYSRISSGFSKKRFHPVLKRFRAHQGIDYAAPKGTPVMAVGNGTISEAGYSAGNGNYVKIRHNNSYSTQYLHLSRFGKGIRKGVSVTQGQIIGYVGSTGLATGPHLCYRFWKEGVQIDPMKLKIPPSESVNEKYIAEFDSVKKAMVEKLKAQDNYLF